jgi:hypothetical protein
MEAGAMNRSTLLFLGLSSVTPGAALGTTEASPTAPLPPGALTSSDHSDEWKIENALSAAPPAIADQATVRDLPADLRGGDVSAGRILRPGTNGWTCLPDIPGRPQHDPICMDATMSKWLSATLSGRSPEIDRVGLAYMLLGEARADPGDILATKPPPGKDWSYVGPHVMVVLPDSCRKGLADIQKTVSNGPYVTAVQSSSPLLVIPVAKAGDRVTASTP